jgi:hypothetical protein
MSMRKSDIAIIAAALLAGAATAYFVYPAPTLEQRAMSAYKAGNYEAAIPLLKKWAALPDVRANPAQQRIVVAYLIDSQQRLKGAATSPAVAAGAAPAAAPDPAQLLAQAQAVAGAQAGAAEVAMGADRIPHTPFKPGEVRTMTIKQVGNFEYDPAAESSTIPADVKNLDGGHFKLRGFMLPLNQSLLITDFALVPSLFSCCFGQPPGVQHIITCKLPQDKAVECIMDELWVEGTMHVNVKKTEGYTYSIFEMDVTSIKPIE